MTDSLRDRIADAICNWYFGEDTAWEETAEPSREEWRGCADAVIAALGLREENHELLTRYVTKWEMKTAAAGQPPRIRCWKCDKPVTPPDPSHRG